MKIIIIFKITLRTPKLIPKIKCTILLEQLYYIFIILDPKVPQRDCSCRNPTLAKCGGEARHLEKLEIWSPPGLPNDHSLTTRPKTPCIGAFLVSLERF